MNPVALGDTVFPQFATCSAATGAATNADSTPTVTVEEDGVAMGYAPTVSNIATGLYRYQLDVTGGNGFEAGKRYVVYVVATVGGVTGRAPIDDFEVLTTALDTVSSRTDAAVSSRLATASYTAPLDAAGTRSAVGLASANLDTKFSNLQTHGDASWATATGFSTLTATDVWAKVVEAGFTAEEMLRLIASVAQGDASGLEGSSPVFKSIDGLKDRVVASYAAGARTVSSRDAS